MATCGADLCLAGLFSNTITLGNTTLTSRGEWDIFVWRRPAL